MPAVVPVSTAQAADSGLSIPSSIRAEHQKIGAALQSLRTPANEGKSEAAQFADHLLAHATEEKQIFYPAAMLVGDYLKLK